MKISVLIAAHHHGLQLPEALASIRAQSHPDWELVVVEYDSADETRSLVREFGASSQRPVHYLNLGEGHGPASARNRLLDLATSDLVAFLDPTDQWTPRHLSSAVEVLDREADVAASDVRLFEHSTGRPAGHISLPAQLSSNPARTLFTRDILPVPSSIVFRRELVKRVGLIDPQFKAAETRDFWLRCALGGVRFAATHRATCQSTWMKNLDSTRQLNLAEQTVRFYEKHRKIPAVPAATRRRFLSASLASQGRLLRASDPMRAAKCIWRAWSLQPIDIQTLGQFALTGWASAAQESCPIGTSVAHHNSAKPFPIEHHPSPDCV